MVLTRDTARARFLTQLSNVSVQDAEPIVGIIRVLWMLSEILATGVKFADFKAALP